MNTWGTSENLGRRSSLGVNATKVQMSFAASTASVPVGPDGSPPRGSFNHQIAGSETFACIHRRARAMSGWNSTQTMERDGVCDRSGIHISRESATLAHDEKPSTKASRLYRGDRGRSISMQASLRLRPALMHPSIHNSKVAKSRIFSFSRVLRTEPH